MNFHTIRLHGPWNAKVRDFFSPSATASPEAIPAECRQTIPSDWSQWLGDSFRGVVDYRRNFNRPTRLSENQKVWLVVEEADFLANVTLNDKPIGSRRLGDLPLRVEVGSLLESSNQLLVSIELPFDVDRDARTTLAGGLIGSVRLEIEEPSS